ncbi:MAG: TIGR04282 family arsenosugar biosynthesis glycosyltransferase [Acidobacteriales bacterium]|nr:TIGR04282 family arsenosugar biosynthesis glycosyltransferase [Terriglobales bacterium]
MTDDRVAVCVFAKPPRPGEVKTRLAAGIGDEAASRLAHAFLLDTLQTLQSLSWVMPVVASTDPFFAGDGIECWLQGEGNLGNRIERILRRGLRQASCAIALGADSPGLPSHLLESARQALAAHDAVLGPCDDGGFYLLGVRRCPPGCLGEVRWSSQHAASDAGQSMAQAGMSVTVQERWFDVDTEEDLDRLRQSLAEGTLHAPHTAAELARLAMVPNLI